MPDMTSDVIPNFRLKNIFNTSFTPPQVDSPQSVSTPAAPTTSEAPSEDITSRMTKLYHPQTEASDRLNELMSNYPKGEDYEPSWLRSIAGAIISAGASYNPDRGFMLNPVAMQLGQNFADKPYNDALEEWKNKIGPTQKAAELENQQNTNERLAAYEAISQELRNEAEKHKEANDEVLAKIKQQRADIYDFKSKNPTLKFLLPKGGNIQAANPVSGELTDTGVPVGSLSELDKLNLTQENVLDQIAAKGKESRETEAVKEAGREKIADTRGWTSANIPDPNNPGQMMGVMIHQATGEVRPIQLGGQNVGAISKPTSGAGGGITNSTKTMMEGATMLRPHINDLRSQAVDLDKRGLFGPVMSRVRDLAAKIGTTGSPEQVQASLDEFANNVVNDPRLNASNDRVVGQFLTNLGLMSSGAGRVHGGARGGGSIQMVQYLKSLLSSSSSLDMFQGRLDSLDSYMKGYSAGPIPATSGAVGVKKSKIDAAIDEILKGVK